MRYSITTVMTFLVLVLNTSTINGEGIPINEFTNKIKHVVYLMLENRSFDHLAGYFDIEGLNGLKGTEKNYLNPQDPNSPVLTPKMAAKYRTKADPDHTASATTRCIFGVEKEPDVYPDVAPMNGFVMEAADGWDTTKIEVLEDAMHAFDPEHIPVTYALAKEYAIFDAWHSSVPGPTHPNRMFAFTGTSNGVDEIDPIASYITGFPQKPFFAHLDHANIKWNVYYHDVPELLLLQYMRNPFKWNHLKRFDTFKEHAKQGALPPFSVIEPRYFGANENDNHPPADTRKTEELLKDVYETLRASPTWSSTLLIITYDEHGGMYDHVSPPMKDIPSPDGKKGNYIKFDRLGIRVPTIMVSPWIKQSVIHRPNENQRPFPSSEFEHTSVVATLKKVWELPTFLTARDAWAGTFEDIFSNEPRDDCPESLPSAPPMTKTDRNWWHTEKNPSPMQSELLSILQGAVEWVVSLLSTKNSPLANARSAALQELTIEDIGRLTPEQLENKAEGMMDFLRTAVSTLLQAENKNTPKSEELQP